MPIVPRPATATTSASGSAKYLAPSPAAAPVPPSGHPVAVHVFDHCLNIIEDKYTIVVRQLLLEDCSESRLPIYSGHVDFSADPARHSMHIAVVSGVYSDLCRELAFFSPFIFQPVSTWSITSFIVMPSDWTSASEIKRTSYAITKTPPLYVFPECRGMCCQKLRV